MTRPIQGFCPLPRDHDGPHQFVPIYAGPSTVLACNARGPVCVVTVKVSDPRPARLSGEP